MVKRAMKLSNTNTIDVKSTPKKTATVNNNNKQQTKKSSDLVNSSSNGKSNTNNAANNGSGRKRKIKEPVQKVVVEEENESNEDEEDDESLDLEEDDNEDQDSDLELDEDDDDEEDSVEESDSEDEELDIDENTLPQSNGEGESEEEGDDYDEEEEEEDDNLNALEKLSFEEFVASIDESDKKTKSKDSPTKGKKKKNSIESNSADTEEKNETQTQAIETIPPPHPDPKNYDEYAEDSSDEEDIRNTIGNVPVNWYDEYPHIGYDLDGKKLIKPVQGDKLDEFLSRMEDPDFWRTVKDKQTGQKVILSDKDMELIQRIQAGNVPDPDFNDYAPWIEWFSSEVMETPLRAIPQSKASFLPSKIDKMKISKMVHAIKMGWMKPKPKPPTEPQFYMLWDSDDKSENMRRIHQHISAPKIRLPGNAESYNPPAEYLFDDNEVRDWEQKADQPWKRKYNFVPKKHKALRNVPAYDRYIKERFERCLDLYLCPRAKKMRLTIKAEDLVPQLPNPKDLQPFPTVLSMTYKGHTGMVRSISLEPHGQFFASGSDDGTVKIWEIATGRCMKTFVFEGTVRCVEWCPSKSLSLVAVAVDTDVMIINPGVGDKLVVEKTDALLRDSPDMGEYVPSDRVAAAVTWEPVDEEKRDKNIRIVIRHFKTVTQVTWHGKGDYFASIMPDGQNRSVVIHQLSSRKSQLPLSRSKGLVQCAIFHPIRPCFFVATQRHVRIYDLVKQQMVKKLLTGSKWISSLAVHPAGDNLIIGGYDKKVSWFDLDLSTKPYQTLRHHTNAVRSVAFHKRYPLFASGSDDCSVIVCHGMVYNDLLQNPLIVPVKKLKGHSKANDFGVLSVQFHNMQPWVFSSGADQTITLFT